VVENRGGAGGNIGGEAVAGAARRLHAAGDDLGLAANLTTASKNAASSRGSAPVASSPSAPK